MVIQRPPFAAALQAFVRELPHRPWRTRFAPAPTGRLHLGHLVNAVFVWGLSRAYGGRVLLRIEDHDRRRCRPEFERALLDELDWLGLHAHDIGSATYDEGSFLRQSDNDRAYTSAADRLQQANRVFVCRCTRRDIARQESGRFGVEVPYPGTCRNLHLTPDVSRARRLMLDDTREQFDDLRLGAQEQRPVSQCGDLLIRDRLGQWTYQFAVTVDDVDQQVDVVIRGEDLLESTGRQLALARLLGRTSPPRYLHHPLLYRVDGLKLSKSQGDTGIGELRAMGFTAASLLGMAAHRAGLTPSEIPIEAGDLGSLFV